MRMKTRVLKTAILCFFSLLILSVFISTQMQNHSLFNLQIAERQCGEVTKNLNNHVKLRNVNSTCRGDINIKEKIDADKRCFRLSWNYSFQLHSYDKHCRNCSRDKPNSLSNTNKQKCNRFITIGRSAGRMGNQMFEIASVIGVAYSYDIIPVIPHTFPLNEYIELPNRYDTGFGGLENAINCYCKKAAVFYRCKNALHSAANVTMHGYLQSWKYFYDIRHIIRKVFSMKTQHLINAREFLSNVTKYGYQHVCIHVRRGDFTYQSNTGYTIADDSFITRAKRYFMNKYSKVDFVLTTDDKIWCRRNVKDVAISPFKSPGDDMALMILSDHVIVTSGTFGWWGAWLSGGTTVYFKGYPGRGLLSKYNIYDYYPPNWIGL